MLDYAIKYESKLKELYLSNVVGNPFYDYWNSDYYNFNLTINNSDWTDIQKVSIFDNKLYGYLAATIDRQCSIVTGLSVYYLYSNTLSVGFIRDLIKFIDDLFMIENASKIKFYVIVGNPAERMYDKFISTHGGRIVGYYKNDAIIKGHGLCNKKLYEIMREDYLLSKEKKVNDN